MKNVSRETKGPKTFSRLYKAVRNSVVNDKDYVDRMYLGRGWSPVQTLRNTLAITLVGYCLEKGHVI